LLNKLLSSLQFVKQKKDPPAETGGLLNKQKDN